VIPRRRRSASRSRSVGQRAAPPTRSRSARGSGRGRAAGAPIAPRTRTDADRRARLTALEAGLEADRRARLEALTREMKTAAARRQRCGVALLGRDLSPPRHAAGAHHLAAGGRRAEPLAVRR
jgi:hypothetical protein